MSYLSPGSNISKKLEIAEITISGNLTTINTYFTFDSLDQHTFTTAPTGLSTDVLTLPPGHYFARSTLSATRTNTNDNYQFISEVDGSTVGREGHTGWYLNLRSDFCEAEFSSTSDIELKLKLVGLENGALTLDGHSKLWLWRTDL